MIEESGPELIDQLVMEEECRAGPSGTVPCSPLKSAAGRSDGFKIPEVPQVKSGQSKEYTTKQLGKLSYAQVAASESNPDLI